MARDLSRIIRDGIATAHALTASVQVEVTHYAQTGARDPYGRPVRDAGRRHRAIVERRHRLLVRRDGTEVESLARVTFLAPVGALEGDEIQLPEGDRWTVLRVDGLVDPQTKRPYLEVVHLGAVV